MRRTSRLIYDPARKLYQPAQSEEDVLGAIRTLLEANGARVHRIVERIPWGKTTSTPGIPDLMGWMKRPVFDIIPEDYHTFRQRETSIIVPFFIEVKRPGGKLRPAQAAWIEQAKADGVIAFKAESVEEMVREFGKYGIEIKGLSGGKA